MSERGVQAEPLQRRFSDETLQLQMGALPRGHSPGMQRPDPRGTHPARADRAAARLRDPVLRPGRHRESQRYLSSERFIQAASFRRRTRV